MTENFEPADCDRNSINRTGTGPVSGRRFISLFTVLVMIAGLVFASIQPASATAPAGMDWTARTATELNSWRGVTYGNGTFVAVAYDGTNRVMTSADGTTWTPHAAAATTDNMWWSVTYGNGVFVAVAPHGSGTKLVMTSPNGSDWTARTAVEASYWKSVTFGNGKFVAVASDGTKRVMTSTDGITWTAQTAAEASSWQSVTYGLVGGTGMFVAVSSDGANRIMTSPDGVTWTTQTAAQDSSWQSVTYGGGTFVAVAQGGTKLVMTSTDGSTWTTRTAANAAAWSAVTYGGGMFVAVNYNYGGTQAMTSSDGISWTLQTTPGDSNWRSVTYGGGTFVAVAINGTDRVMTGVFSWPDAPTSLVATPGNGSASIAFTPGGAGTSAITKYQYQIGSGAWLDAPAGTTSPVMISGLTNYAVNSIKLRAYNNAGGGTASSPVAVTPKVSAPVITSAFSGTMAGVVARGINVGFAGVTSPGATMASYRINVYTKGTNTVVSTLSVSRNIRSGFLGGLTRGVEYDVRVTGYLTVPGSPLITRATYESATTTVRV